MTDWPLRAGTPVWLRGEFAREFTMRGIVEAPRLGSRVGIRLENGNFKWALKADVMERGLNEQSPPRVYPQEETHD